MIYTATVTSQGQITIPISFRREINLDRAQITIKKNAKGNLEIEKIADILSLGGSLHKYAKINKGKTIDEIIKMENKAIGEAIEDRYRRKMKKIGIPVPNNK